MRTTETKTTEKEKEDKSSGEDDEDSVDEDGWKEDDGKKVWCIWLLFSFSSGRAYMVHYYYHGFALWLVLLYLLCFPLQYCVACSTNVPSVHCRGF